jgi:hypothetical protein
MKIKIVAIIYIFISQVVFSNSNINIDKFYFDIFCPNQVLYMDNINKQKYQSVGNQYKLQGKYLLYIDYVKISDSLDINPKYKDKSSEYIQSKLLDGNSILSYGIKESYSKFIIDNKIIGESFFYIYEETISNQYSKVLYFISDDYLVTITIVYFDINHMLLSKYPHLFKRNKKYSTYAWKNVNALYKSIVEKSNKAPKELITLNNLSSFIIETLRFTEFDEPAKIYLSKVKCLRLRNEPSIESSKIRCLKKGESLLFIKKGWKETVNNVQGSWVQVKTEQGETGWCFDAYLEEWKE